VTLNSQIKDGVLLVAHSKRSYWREAATLARSIRRFSSDIHISLATNLNISETEWKNAGFTSILQHDFSALPGLDFKWHLDSISPYHRTTLFLDSDCICYGDISSVFAAFEEKEFIALGKSRSEYHWFRDSASVRHTFDICDFPTFCGGFYLFRRTPLANNIFITARELAARYDQLGICRLGSFRNDEPLFALAMAEYGVMPEPQQAWIVNMTQWDLRSLSVDYVPPMAECQRGTSCFFPKLVHFQAFRNQPIYYRERFSVHALGKPWCMQSVARIAGCVESFGARVAKKLALR